MQHALASRRGHELRRPQKITFGEMRSTGVHGISIYCADYHCSHSIAISADLWPDDVRRSDLEPRFVCKACGKRGADVRPDFHWNKPPVAAMGYRPWSARFNKPIPLPRGRKLVTLQDAGTYITKLPKAEREAPEWQAAMEALILVATHGGPTMFARIGDAGLEPPPTSRSSSNLSCSACRAIRT
jgi:hypothetical protein